MIHTINVIEDNGGCRFFTFEGLTFDAIFAEWIQDATHIQVLNEAGERDMGLKIQFVGTHDPIPFLDSFDEREGVPPITNMVPWLEASQLKKGASLSVEFSGCENPVSAQTLRGKIFQGWVEIAAAKRIPDIMAWNNMGPSEQDAISHPIFRAIIAEANANPDAPLRF